MTENLTNNSIVKGQKKGYVNTGSYEAFKSKYCPIENAEGSPLNDDLNTIKQFNESQIWTVVEGDSGKLYILPGYHFVNRTGYYIVCKNARGDGHHRTFRYN